MSIKSGGGQFQYEEIWKQLNNCPQLTSLAVEKGTHDRAISASCSALSNANIKIIEFNDVLGAMEPNTLATIAENLTGLVDITIMFQSVNLREALTPEGAWARLENLDVSNCPQFGDVDLVTLGTSCPALARLTAWGTQITHIGIRLYSGSNNLERISVGGRTIGQNFLLEVMADSYLWTNLTECEFMFWDVEHDVIDPNQWRQFCATVGAQLKELKMFNFWVDEDMLLDLRKCKKIETLVTIGADWLDFLHHSEGIRSVMPQVICEMQSLRSITARKEFDPENTDTQGPEEAFVSRVRAMEILHGVSERELCFWE